MCIAWPFMAFVDRVVTLQDFFFLFFENLVENQLYSYIDPFIHVMRGWVILKSKWN